MTNEQHESKWHVMVYTVCGERFFRCWRMKDPEGSYGSTNREMDNIAFDNPYEAEARCRELNGLGFDPDPEWMKEE